MRKMTATVRGVFLLGLLQTGAQADFVFSGSDDGGTGSATLSLSVSGNTLTASLYNTSPTVLDVGVGDNAPGIVGFGFNAIDIAPTLSSWSLRAFEATDGVVAGTDTLIGSSAGAADDEWVMGTFLDGVALDFFPTTDNGNVDGAIFNPDAVSSLALPGGSNDTFFSKATLVMNFSGGLNIDETSFFVRMKNVGRGGDGSLKLPGIPLPAALWMGLCMLGGMGAVGAWRHRK
jgi:hypothetical protein